MAIYTTKNFGMLTAEPLDKKRVMTENQWDADVAVSLSYPGQLYYSPNDGWFRVYGKVVDNDTAYDERQIFGLGIDGVVIGDVRNCFIYNGGLNLSRNDDSSILYAMGSDGYVNISPGNYFDVSYMPDGMALIAVDYNNSFLQSNMSKYTFGISNQIVSNTGNKVITMYGTGLKTSDPYCNQLIIGQYNEDNCDAVFIVGNGSTDRNRSNSVTIYPDGEIYVKEICSPDDTLDRIRNAVTAVEYLCLTVDTPTTTDTGLYTIELLPSGVVVDKVIIKISEAFEDGELLDIFTMKNNDKTYIIKDYPISKIPAGSLAIENMFTEMHDGDIYMWRHGIDYTKLPGYTETIGQFIYGNFLGDAKVYISTSKDIRQLHW